MKRTFLILLLTVLLSLASSFAPADIVTLKDGTTHEGKVIEENGAQVIIEISIANIKTTKTFPRYKVRSIEYTPEEAAAETEEEATPSTPTSSSEREQTPTDLDQPEIGTGDDDTDATGEDDAEEERMTPAERLAARRNRTLFIVIPVEGMIGEQTSAEGLRIALGQAARKRVEHIVFTVDSPGGYVYDAVETLKVLKEHDAEFTYHAYIIEGAISAASVYVAAADHIWVRPDARVGGAVAYSQDSSSGAAEVDAKFNSIWAAEIAARAESKGHPPEVFRAMVEPGAEVWTDAENKVYASRPSTPGAQQLDSGSTILTIRAGQMVQIGMAEEFTGPATGLGEQMDIAGWAEVRGVGMRAMESAAKERVKLGERMEVALKFYLEKTEKLKETDPRAFTDYRAYIIRNRYATEDRERAADGPSLNRWRERSRNAIAECDHMLEALREIAAVDKRAKSTGALHLQIPTQVGDDAFNIISGLRDWFWKNRDRIPNEMFIEGATVGP